MKTLVKENEDLTSKFKIVVLEAQTLSTLAKCLKESLEKAFHFKKKLEGTSLSMLIDEFVDMCNKYIERVKEQVAFLHPVLELSQMDLLNAYI